MKNIKKILGVGALALAGLTGCSPPVKQMGTFEDYPVQYRESRLATKTVIRVYSKERDMANIEFLDLLKDGTVDMIVLNVNKGDALEKYACFEVGQKLLDDFLVKNSAFNQGFKEGKKAK